MSIEGKTRLPGLNNPNPRVSNTAPENISITEIANGCPWLMYFLLSEVNVAASAALSNPVMIANV